MRPTRACGARHRAAVIKEPRLIPGFPPTLRMLGAEGPERSTCPNNGRAAARVPGSGRLSVKAKDAPAAAAAMRSTPSLTALSRAIIWLASPRSHRIGPGFLPLLRELHP